MKVIGEKAGKTILVDSNCWDGRANIPPVYPLRRFCYCTLFVTREPAYTEHDFAFEEYSSEGYQALDRLDAASLDAAYESRATRSSSKLLASKVSPVTCSTRYTRRRGAALSLASRVIICIYIYKSSPCKSIPARATVMSRFVTADIWDMNTRLSENRILFEILPSHRRKQKLWRRGCRALTSATFPPPLGSVEDHRWYAVSTWFGFGCHDRVLLLREDLSGDFDLAYRHSQLYRIFYK